LSTGKKIRSLKKVVSAASGCSVVIEALEVAGSNLSWCRSFGIIFLNTLAYYGLLVIVCSFEELKNLYFYTGTEFIVRVKMLNFTFGKLTVAQNEFAKHFL
jgi:hypothetical protein